MNNAVEITVNGKTLEHNIGDHWYKVEFGADGFTPEVKESLDCIGFIKIGKFGNIYYYDETGYELTGANFAYKGYFWTKFEAEKWIEENVPKNPKITKNTYIYIVNANELERKYVKYMMFAKGAFRYKLEGEDWLISEEDFGNNVFFTYEEAKAVRDKFEKSFYKEDIND